jgi:hypothetical protein
MFIHSKDMVVRWGKIKCLSQAKHAYAVERLIEGTSHYINEFDV